MTDKLIGREKTLALKDKIKVSRINRKKFYFAVCIKAKNPTTIFIKKKSEENDFYPRLVVSGNPQGLLS